MKLLSKMMNRAGIATSALVLAAPAIVTFVLLAWTWWRWADRPDDPVRVVFGMAFEMEKEFPGKMRVVFHHLPLAVQPGSPLAARLAPEGEAFYFVHSFHCVPADPALVLAECDYGGAFCAAIGRGRVFATQFHPEKSQAKGLQVYRNFAQVAAAAGRG